MHSASDNLRYPWMWMALVLLLALASSPPSAVLAFTPPHSRSKPVGTTRHITELRGISKWNDQYQSAPDDDDEEEEELITREMFMREQLSVKRKKKGSTGEYKPHDNRDSLPFVVKVKTPDPYTSDEEMLKQARENSSSDLNGLGDRAARSNLVGVDSGKSRYANTIAASIMARRRDGTMYKVLGSFELEKNTNCGDLLQVGDREFEVVTARSQFK